MNVQSFHRAAGGWLHDRPPLYAVPTRRIRRLSYMPAGRTLHVLDVENEMGGPREGNAAMVAAFDAYVRVTRMEEHDHVIIGANHRLGVEAKILWPGCQVVVGGGEDGADRALIDAVADVEWAAARFDRVIIGSGDGIFVPIVEAFAGLGIPVGVVARPSSMSLRLRARATFCLPLPEREPRIVQA